MIDALFRLPQWSPVVTTGTTSEREERRVDGRRAAMEPRRDDGDDVGLRGVADAHAEAAMEPRRDDGDDPTSTGG